MGASPRDKGDGIVVLVTIFLLIAYFVTLFVGKCG
jgi:hypothetical protein